MKIGEVSQQLGIPASTIRYYEQVGLIERQSRVAGKRSFNGKALSMLQFVKLAQSAGFSIRETKTLLDNYSADPSRGGLWRDFAEAKQSTIRLQIKSLEQCVQAAALHPRNEPRNNRD